MPQPSYPYACARLSALEKGLLDAATLRRMADSSLDDAMRVLLDARYGSIPDATPSDCERMIDTERRTVAREIRELSPNPALTDLFLLETDVHNLKILIKARLLGETRPEWSEGGLFCREHLDKWISDGDYRQLPAPIAAALTELDAILRVGIAPQKISVLLDRAYLVYAMDTAKRCGASFAERYFTALCDFDNVLTFLRMRAMGALREDMRDMLLAEGTITHKALLDAYELSYDSLNRVLSDSIAKDALITGLAEMQRTGRIGALEKARDDYLLSLIKPHRYDVTTIYPIVGYLLAKQREAQAIRLIITVKRNGLDDAVIGERLRELYG